MFAFITSKQVFGSTGIKKLEDKFVNAPANNTLAGYWGFSQKKAGQLKGSCINDKSRCCSGFQHYPGPGVLT
jgi:hypothetical protein